MRTYPQGSLFGHPVGFYFVDIGNSGIEVSENDLLTGEDNEFDSIIDQLQGETPQGADITLTIDAELSASPPSLQEAIDATHPGVRHRRLRGRDRALDGRRDGDGLGAGLRPEHDQPGRRVPAAEQEHDAPLVNRADPVVYEPGSTMKVVTAAAALDSGEFTPDTSSTATPRSRSTGCRSRTPAARPSARST